MKTCYAIAGLCLAVAQTYAQPVIGRQNLSETFTGTLHRAAADGFDPGMAGANRTWDYSALVLQNTGTVAYSPPDGTPYAATFNQANFTHHYTGSFNETWHYYKVSDDKVDLHCEIYPGIFGANYTQNPKTIIEFPYTFNRIYNDSYRIAGQGGDVLFTATYDAYGTLILPFGTFQDVVRQKIVTGAQTEYIWYNVNPFFPLLQTSLENNLLGMMQNTTLGQPDFSRNSAMALYPNPAQEMIHMSIGGQNIEKLVVCVYDLSGKLVWQQTESRNFAAIPTEELPAGLYLLKATDQDGHTHAQKFMKV